MEMDLLLWVFSTTALQVHISIEILSRLFPGKNPEGDRLNRKLSKIPYRFRANSG